MVHDLASERRLDSSRVLNTGELKDGLFQTHIRMNQQQSFSNLAFFPWRLKFLKEHVGGVTLHIPLPEGQGCKLPRRVVQVDAGMTDTDRWPP